MRTKYPFKAATSSLFLQCIKCDTVFDADNLEDLECDGDIMGFCPKCKNIRIFYEVKNEDK